MDEEIIEKLGLLKEIINQRNSHIESLTRQLKNAQLTTKHFAQGLDKEQIKNVALKAKHLAEISEEKTRTISVVKRHLVDLAKNQAEHQSERFKSISDFVDARNTAKFFKKKLEEEIQKNIQANTPLVKLAKKTDNFLRNNSNSINKIRIGGSLISKMILKIGATIGVAAGTLYAGKKLHDATREYLHKKEEENKTFPFFGPENGNRTMSYFEERPQTSKRKLREDPGYTPPEKKQMVYSSNNPLLANINPGYIATEQVAKEKIKNPILNNNQLPLQPQTPATQKPLLSITDGREQKARDILQVKKNADFIFQTNSFNTQIPLLSIDAPVTAKPMKPAKKITSLNRYNQFNVPAFSPALKKQPGEPTKTQKKVSIDQGFAELTKEKTLPPPPEEPGVDHSNPITENDFLNTFTDSKKFQRYIINKRRQEDYLRNTGQKYLPYY